MKTIALAAMVALLPVSALTQARPAQAYSPGCAPTSKTVKLLTGDKYGEQVAFIGMQHGDKVIVKVWVNPETGSWTVTQSNTHGVTCIRGAGKSHDLEEIDIPDDA